MERSLRRRPLLSAGLVILLFLSALPVWAQYGDPTENRAVIGRDFPAVIKTEYHYSPDIEMEVPPLPEGVQITSGPYLRYYRKEVITEGRKEYQTLAEIRFNLRASVADIFEIPGIILHREGISTQLEPFYFMSFRWEEFSNLYPLNVHWRDIPAHVYQGQAVPLLLEAAYTESILFPDNISMHNPEGALLERVSLPGAIEIFQLDETHKIYRYPLESWIFTSLETGKISLPRGEVHILGMKRTIPEITLDVRPLPDIVQGSGAVGQFTRTVELYDSDIMVGDSIEVRLILEGRGNLPQVHMADPVLQGWELINHQEEMDILPDAQWGYVGSRSFIYKLHSRNAGATDIEFETFYYQDPSRDASRRLAAEKLSLNVMLPEIQDNPKNLYFISTAEVADHQDWFRLNNLYLYLFPLPLLMIMVILMIMKKKKWGFWSLALVFCSFLFMSAADSFSDNLDILKEAENAYQQEDYQTALQLYHGIQENFIHNSYFLYNLSILQWKLEDPAQAQLTMRSALKIKPGYPLFREALLQMNQDFLLENQYEGLLLLRQGWFLIGFMVTTFFLVLWITLHFILNRTGTLLYLMAFFLLWAVFSFSLIYLTVENRKEQIVVMQQDTPLRKISGEFARDWIFLPAGTSLEVQDSYGDFLFIRTGYGLEGWIKRDQTASLKGGYNG